MAKAKIVVGLGFGDEGKGALVSFLAEELKAKLVVRFNGGAQAAHNVVTPDGRHHTFAQFGSGTLSGAPTLLSRKCLVNPGALFNEARHLAEIGVANPLSLIRVERGALVTTPYQMAVNKIRETRRGAGRHGSCGMGIFETVQDSVDRPDLAVRASDLAGRVEGLRRRLENLRLHKLEQAEALQGEDGEEAQKALEFLRDPGSSDWVADDWSSFASLVQVVKDGWLEEQMRSPGEVVFEGAQGTLLDENWGFFPYATRSTATFDGAIGLTAGASSVLRIGVVRSYMTRHGAGPFVTESAAASRLSEGDHNGSGPWQQGFRSGWMDLVALRYACLASCADGLGPDCLAVSHLDKESRMVATAYDLIELDGELFEIDGGLARGMKVRRPPSLEHQERLARALAKARPALRETKSEEGLLRQIEAAASAPVKIAGRGPRRSDWSSI